MIRKQLSYIFFLWLLFKGKLDLSVSLSQCLFVSWHIYLSLPLSLSEIQSKKHSVNVSINPGTKAESCISRKKLCGTLGEKIDSLMIEAMI